MAGTHRALVNTSKAPQPIGAYSQAVRATGSGLLFIAGQVAVDLEGNLVGEGDAVAQTRQVFANIAGILESVGASFSDVVEFTSYLVGKESIPLYIQARREIFPNYLPDSDFPANTLLIVESLVREEFLVEVKAVAALP
jgi:enamine deaminase RidA (YjgF/YER057c/UK114 family)